MKTTSKIASLLILVVTFFLMTGATVKKAACPYAIKNVTQCKVMADITLFNKDCSVCTTIFGVTIAPGTGYSIPCSGCALPLCNIVVNVTALNGMPVGTSADFNNPGFFPANPCAASYIKYDPSASTFVIMP